MNRLVSDTWFPEVFFLSASWAVFLSTVILLQNFDQEPVFSWYDLGLNTVISTLSTASKSSLLFVISSCIGQWTYIAFVQFPGPIIHFDTHDGASRGPWGSLILLWRHRKRLYKSPPALGAALIIISLFVDPFFQQIIALGELQTTRNHETIQVPRAVRYSKGIEMPLTTATIELADGRKYKALGTWTDFSMQAAIRAGLASPNAKARVDARCPSTTCAWEKYTTLAVCGKCFDVTKNLSKKTETYDIKKPHMPLGLQLWGGDSPSMAWTGDLDIYSLPNGLYMESETMGLKMVISGTYNTTNTVNFKNETRLLWSISTITYQNASEIPFTASECGLSLCVKEVISKSVNGVLEEQSVKIDVPTLPNSQQPQGVNDQNLTDPEAGLFITIADHPRQGKTAPGANTVRRLLMVQRDIDLIFEGNISITQSSINNIGKELKTLFVDDATWASEHKQLSGYYISGSEIDGEETARYAPDPMKVLYSSPDLGKLFDQLAESMTNNLRSEDENATVVLGTSSIVVYKIRWIYIVLPAVSILGSTSFFFLSVWQTRRLGAPLWKSSAIAVLKCGATLQGFAQDQTRVSEMDTLAKSTAFQLNRYTYQATQSSTMLKQNTSCVSGNSGQEYNGGRPVMEHEMTALPPDQHSWDTAYDHHSLRSVSPINDITR